MQRTLSTALDGLNEETVVSVDGTVTGNAQAPGGFELTDPHITNLSSTGDHATRRTVAAIPQHQPSHAVGPRAGALASSHPASHLAISSGITARIPPRPRRPGFHRDPDSQARRQLDGVRGQCFAVDYFSRPAYLAQSPQFSKQIMVGVFERVYETGPVFRAEPHDTVRHLAEYVSLDAELGFITDHRDVLSVLRDVVAAMVAEIRCTAADDAELAQAHLPDVPDEIPTIHFRDALQLVGANPDEPDLAPEHERHLGQWVREKFGSDFLAVEGYPAKKRPFYTHPQPDDPYWTNSFDLLSAVSSW